MKLVCSKSKNSANYYIQKTIRIGNKTTTKTIERLGSINNLIERANGMDPIEWAKEYARKLTAEEKKENSEVILKFSPSKQIHKGQKRSVNVGYLFLQKIYYELGLHKICRDISEKYKFQFDLNAVLSMLLYTRILFPSSKYTSLELSERFLEKPDIELQHVYRALEVLAAENDFFQAQLYKNSQKVIKRKKGVLFYDCTNYYFEIEHEDEFRKYGFSKEHKPNPIVQMGLFMDSDGIPLSFSLFKGNENEQPSMTPLESKIIRNYDIDEFIVCTDSGLSSTANRKFNNVMGRKFVTTQSIKKLKKFLQDFCLDDDGWHLEGKKQIFRLSEIDETLHFNNVFYKDRWINEDGIEQQLIVTYSPKYKNYQQKIREAQVNRALKRISNPSSLKHRRQNDHRRFIREEHCTNDGQLADKTVASLNQKLIDSDSLFDGFYAVCTNIEANPTEIIKINNRRWEIEECFRIMKSEFKARPIYLRRKDRITAHFITCFTSLIMYRILEKRLGNSYTCSNIINTLKNMNMMSVPGEGYIPEYMRTDITDRLHDEFGFRTDYQIISKKNMKKILTSTKH